jgi:hypothetical protein
MRLLEPSGLAWIAIGRTPLSNRHSQAIESVERSMTVMSFFEIEPPTKYLPSGVT